MCLIILRTHWNLAGTQLKGCRAYLTASLTEDNKFGLEGLEVNDVEGTSEHSQGNQEHWRADTAGGETSGSNFRVCLYLNLKLELLYTLLFKSNLTHVFISFYI